MNGYLEYGDPADKQYKSLMKILKQFHKENAIIENWDIEYEMVMGKATGVFWITVNGREVK